MSNTEQRNQPAGLNVADILFVLFRHKWLILACSAAGLVAAFALYKLKPALYTSEGKLLVKYVVADKPLAASTGDQILVPDSGGMNILNNEVQILKSLDLTKQILEVVGPERVLGNNGKDRERALETLNMCLTVEAVPRSDVITVRFQHRDATLVQPVLDMLITNYVNKSKQARREAGDPVERLQQRTNAVLVQLAETKEQLRQAKTKAGVVNLEDSKRSLDARLSSTRQKVNDAEAELYAEQAKLSALQQVLPLKPETAAVASNSTPETVWEDYKGVCAHLATLREKERALLADFTESSELVVNARRQIDQVVKRQHEMEAKYPTLATPGVSGARGVTTPVDLIGEKASAAALEAKLTTLRSQLVDLQAQARLMGEMEAEITQLQMQQGSLEANYSNLVSSLELALTRAALDTGKVSNITVTQAPCSPVRESRKLLKLLAMIVAAGVGGGLVLALLIDLYLDRTVKLPSEIEARLGVPLFLTIPQARGNISVALPAPPSDAQLRLLASGTDEERAMAVQRSAPAGAAPWDPGHGLRAYSEALRDRLATYFDVINLTRKPKLVAVTGCNKGAGVSTIAAGLAATLSETGEGNVLLVDMTLEQGAAHPFYRGKPNFGLEQLLENKQREGAMAQENLYVVSERTNGDKLPRAMPARFSNLVPKLKASDYDYIIFDMPPVNQLSVTPRLAGFMDMVLLVVESEKTNREAVKRATDLLAKAKANTSAILNKTRSYVPQWLLQAPPEA